MPNWCYNGLSVTGDKNKLKPLIDIAKGDGEGFFQAIKPMPKELEGTNAPHDKPNWYDWRLENWGTKWDASDIDWQGLEENDNGTVTIHLSFQTAWSPPEGIFDALNKDFEVQADFEECGVEMEGIYEDGVMTTRRMQVEA